MSEYQYHEFIAIDEPLTPKQVSELRSRSSRASITPTSFVNDYQWGNLKGDPIDWMWRYFDAHVYVANWCTCCLYLRVPKVAFDAATLQVFETESVFSVDSTKTHWLLEWELNESDNYDRFAEEDGRGWMGRLTPLRDELLRGDVRPLYLGWLAGVSAGKVDGETTEPPPPPGLSRLTAAQRSLAEFLEVDEDLLTAAGLSDPQAIRLNSESDAELDAWIAELPTAAKAAMLRLLLTGSAQQWPKAKMGKTAKVNAKYLDKLIEEAITDAYGESEQVGGFFIMIEENLALPFVTEVLGHEVTVAKVDITKHDEIVAICLRGKAKQAIPILDLPMPNPHPEGAEWIDAYRRWYAA